VIAPASGRWTGERRVAYQVQAAIAALRTQAVKDEVAMRASPPHLTM
jgi:hypothetical protein